MQAANRLRNRRKSRGRPAKLDPYTSLLSTRRCHLLLHFVDSFRGVEKGTLRGVPLLQCSYKRLTQKLVTFAFFVSEAM
jgi:hypothetical protein